MNELELKRKKLELSRVGLAREELELKIDEYKDQIARLEANIEIQKAKEQELKAALAELHQK